MKGLTREHLIGHRGARAEAPENTLGGFHYLRQLGINKVELDIHLSQDLELVVIHDYDTLRTTGEQLSISQATAAQLAKLNAALEKRILWDQVEPIPKLEQVLSPWKDLEHIQIEVKPMASPEVRQIMAQQLHSLCQKLQMQNTHTVITSSDLDFIRISKTLNPLAHGLVADTEITNPLQEAQNLGCELLVLNYVLYTETMAADCKAAKMPVSLWTVNDVQVANEMVLRGATSIITDKPKEFLEWIEGEQFT